MPSFRIFVIAFTLGLFSQVVQAVPQYYTFNGNVSAFSDTSAQDFINTTYGVGLNDEVSYTFLVDFDLDGFSTFTDNNGFTSEYVFNDSTTVNILGETITDYFYVEYVGGSGFTELDRPNNPYTYNYGFIRSSDDFIQTVYSMNFSTENLISIFADGLSTSFDIGQDFTAVQRWEMSGATGQSIISSNVKLANICDTLSECVTVSEFSSIWLFLTGLSLLLFRRK